MMLLQRARNTVVAWGLNQAGRLLARRGAHQAAAWCFVEAQNRAPGAGDGLFEAARMHWLGQDYRAARQSLESLLTRQPQHAKALNLLGAVHQVEGRHDEAERHYRAAIVIDPDLAAAHNNLGNVLLAGNDFVAAEQCFRQALICDAGYAEAHCNLALLLNRTGRYEDAQAAAREAIRLKPDFAGAMNNLGSILLNLGKLAEGIAQYRQAVALQPDLIEAQINLAIAVDEPGRLLACMDHFQRLLERQPDSYLALLRLAQAHMALEEYDQAEDYVCRVLALKPDALDAWFLLGNITSKQGLSQRVLEINQQARVLGGGYVLDKSQIFDSLYVEATDQVRLFDLARTWARRYHEHENSDTVPAYTFTNTLNPGRKLKIGYISRDFLNHSVAYFLEPIFRHHDKNRYAIYCYANLFHPDEVTARFQKLADAWRDISLVGDADVLKMMHEDEIDILVDLSGHTNGGRLPLLARRPAPVLVNYLGYPATTGLAAVDYRLVDALTDPPGEADRCHTETLWRLPGGFLTYLPPEMAPEVAPSPFLENGCITFGCFNIANKVTERCVELWSTILHAVPDSRLLLKSLTFSSQRGKDYFQGLFSAQGIAPERVTLFDWLPETSGHLGLYGRIDIALDPFPYNGTTTTCEALWMGVPVITLAGNRHSARVGLSLLTQLGLDDLVADSPEDYFQKAVALAEDKDRLVSLRAGMRERMKNSSLLEHAGFTQKLEQAYREMWVIAAERLRAEREKPVEAV